jgi:hypothetical protein
MFIYSSQDHHKSLGITASHHCSNCGTLTVFEYELFYTLFTLFFFLCAISEKKYLARCTACGNSMPLESARIAPMLSENPLPWWYRNSLKVGVPLFIIMSLAIWGYQEFLPTKARFWANYKPSDCTFSAKFPSFEVREEKTYDNEGIPFSAYTATLDSGEVFRVYVREISSPAFLKKSPTDQIAIFGDSAKSKITGKILRDSTQACAQGLARDISYENKANTIVSRILVSGSRLFILSYISPTDKSNTESAAMFLDSFSLTPVTQK